MKTKIIAIANNKGGIGKTTTTANLGAALAEAGFKVLLVDLDGQANLTQSLGLKGDVWAMMKGEQQPQAYKVTNNLYGIGATPRLTESEIYLPKAKNREYLLKAVLDGLDEAFSFVLVDCPPNVGLLTINALTASTGVIIPLSADYLAIGGTERLEELVSSVQAHTNKNLQVYGYLVTRFQQRRTLNREAAAFISGKYGKLVFSTRIRENVALAEAPGVKASIFDYSPRSNGAADYKSLAEEVITRCTKRK